VPHADLSSALLTHDDSASTPLALIGCSPVVSRLRAQMREAAAATRILLLAEPGLESADLASHLHHRSGCAGPFLGVDCAGAEPAQVERLIFGPAPRAGSELEVVDAGSALARAAGGTLLLDDVGELSAGAQARLARVARDGEALVGGTPRRLELRLIGVCTADLDSGVRDGRLRRELVRQFARTCLAVPPLRARREDITTLAERLMAEVCERAGVPAKTLAGPAMTLLAAMPWHGNISELRSAISQLIAVDGPEVQLEDVLPHVRFDSSLGPAGRLGSLRSARQQFEREYVTQVLRHHGWRINDAAGTLGMLRTNLYRKARQLGIAVTRGER
jgi:DNA-binding NtrC family response regulator